MGVHVLRYNMNKVFKFYFSKCIFQPGINIYLKYCYNLQNITYSTNEFCFKSESIPLASDFQLANNSIEDILKNIENKPLSAPISVTLLKLLRMHILFKNTNSEKFKYDSRFYKLCKTFELNCQKLPPNLLISGLRSLLEIGMNFNNSSIVHAEQALLSRIHQFTFSNLITSLYFHQKYVETKLQNEVVSLLILAIQERISEINTSDIFLILQIYHLFEEKYQKKISEYISNLMCNLTSTDICKIINILAQKSDRNLTILNSASTSLLINEDKLHIKETIDVLYSLKALNYFNKTLLSFLFKVQLREIPKITQPSLISNLLTMCGHLRWKDPEFLEACSGWISKHMKSCKTKEFTSFILTLAALNYKSLTNEKLLNDILPLLNKDSLSPSIWLDIVWSLAILEIIEKKMLEDVLSEKFYKSLIKDPDSRKISNKLKLMNLKALMKNKYPECIFGCNLYFEPNEVIQSNAVENSKKLLIKVLNNFIPNEKYLCLNQETEMGILIDAEFIMDKKMKPLPILEYGIMSKSSEAKQSLPEGCKRVALLIKFFKDYTLNSISLTGVNALAVSLLKSMKYAVVVIPYDEFSRENTEVKKAKYLLKKINDVVNI